MITISRVRPYAQVVTGVLAVLSLVLLTGLPAQAQERKVLKVCADPNSLPFSNKEGQGFENKLAEMLAEDLGIPVEYTWFPQRRGFVRNTLRARDPVTGEYKCDLIMGVPASFELGIATKPYYRSTWVLVYAKGRGLDDVERAEDLDNLDPEVRRGLHVGVHDAAPGATWLARHQMYDQMVGFPVLDGSPDVYPGLLVEKELASGRLDAVILWGPIGGYYAQNSGDVEMKVIPMQSEPGLRFDFSISSAVRYGDGDWKDQVEDFYARNTDKIAALLEEYGVPRVSGSDPQRPDDDDD